MKIAYIIFPYKLPQQLLRLLNALQSDNCSFFVHIDNKADISHFKTTLSNTVFRNITFIKRENSRWGSIGFIKAMLNGIREALNSNQAVDYLHFLSGQDYPIKSTTFIENYLSENREKSFVSYSEVPNKYLGGKDGGMYRFTRYHYQGFENRTMNKIINRCLRHLNFALPKRKFPKYLKKPYNGSTWIGFSTDVAKYIMNFIDVHPDYLAFHKYSYCPDEIFFQTILLNSNDDEIRSGIVNRSLTYTDWGKPGPRPAILTINDFDALSKADQLFARKFDISVDSKVLDIIDEKILSVA